MATASLGRSMSSAAKRAGQAVFSSASELRLACRRGEFAAPTSGHAPGYLQTNVVILPSEYADDFERFCSNNAAPCPLLEVTQPGQFEARRLAPGSDLRTDLPRYRVWRDGQMVEERTAIVDLWRPNLQAFLLGCSFSWEDVLAAADLTPRHMEQGCNVPMFDTSIRLRGSGPFQGNMVVSMRPYKAEDVERVVQITREFPAAHGGPVQIGDPGAIGVAAGLRPEYGDLVSLHEGEVPVFWACGVTPQNALRNAKLPFVITHSPGHMFVADILNEEIKDWTVPGKWSARPDEAA